MTLKEIWEANGSGVKVQAESGKWRPFTLIDFDADHFNFKVVYDDGRVGTVLALEYLNDYHVVPS